MGFSIKPLKVKTTFSRGAESFTEERPVDPGGRGALRGGEAGLLEDLRRQGQCRAGGKWILKGKAPFLVVPPVPSVHVSFAGPPLPRVCVFLVLLFVFCFTKPLENKLLSPFRRQENLVGC